MKITIWSNPPKYLYKYRSFSQNTIKILNESNVYFASPNTFNDPLDCKPCISLNSDIKVLERIFGNFRKYSKLRPSIKLDTLQYFASEQGDINIDGSLAHKYYLHLLKASIQEFLYEKFSRSGVFSLASKWNCPLMWSHYAQNHEGLCLEYLTEPSDGFSKIDYSGQRTICTSWIDQWQINNCPTHEKLILEAFFLSKSKQWRYEKEWRIIKKTIGTQRIESRLKSIIFGLNTDDSVIAAVVRLFSENPDEVKFYRITNKNDDFKLIRERIDSKEILKTGVDRSPWISAKELFQ